MYISTPCPKCKKQVCIDLTITEKLTPATAESTILDVDIVDTCTASDLARDVLNVVSDHIYDGISTHELCRILHDKFRILEQYCCEIVQYIKIELSMYSPDGVHLKYVP